MSSKSPTIVLLSRAVVPDVGELDPRFDLILDTVAGPLLERLWSVLAAGGIIHTVGQAAKQPTTFPAGALFVLGKPRSITPDGIGDTAAPGAADNEVSGDLSTLLDLLTQGRLSAEIGWRRSWREIDQTVAALRDRAP